MKKLTLSILVFLLSSSLALAQFNNGGGSGSAAGQLPGTVTNDNACVGCVGQYITASVASGSAVSDPTTGTIIDITSIPLTAGDWQCTGDAFTSNSVIVNSINAWINTTSVTNPNAPNAGAYLQNGGLTSSANLGGALGSIRISLASTGTAFLSGFTQFTSGTGALYGSIGCRRMR